MGSLSFLISLSSLLISKKLVKPERVLSFPGILEVCHVLPGRIRYHVPILKSEPDLCQKLLQDLEKIEYLIQSDVSHHTGNLVLKFDHNQISPSSLGLILIDLLNLEPMINNHVFLAAWKKLYQISSSLNRSIYEHSKGLIDLDNLISLLLALSSVRGAKLDILKLVQLILWLL